MAAHSCCLFARCVDWCECVCCGRRTGLRCNGAAAQLPPRSDQPPASSLDRTDRRSNTPTAVCTCVESQPDEQHKHNSEPCSGILSHLDRHRSLTSELSDPLSRTLQRGRSTVIPAWSAHHHITLTGHHDGSARQPVKLIIFSHRDCRHRTARTPAPLLPSKFR